MATRLTQVVIDSADVPALANWWAAALGWEVVHLEDESSVLPPPGEPGIELVFVPVNDERVQKNRIHLDLRSATLADQDDLIQRLMAGGATEADIGQGDVLWAVLKDPEGNEFCVLDPRPEYARTGALAAIVVDAEDPPAMARFWIAATGWTLRENTDDSDLIPPGGVGPWLEFVNSKEPHTVKNRVHLDIAPFLEDDQETEVNRLIGLGARPAEVGQSQAAPGTVTWVVLADPEQNEFCVLSAR
jgi:predicted enzyme related to lactoylglutathione lyase